MSCIPVRYFESFDLSAFCSQPMLRRLTAWIRLGHNQFLYWLNHIPRETYHANAASFWHDLEEHEKCILHCKKYLSISPNDHMRGMLAYSYIETEECSKAVNTYRSFDNVWQDPLDALGLAFAEMRCGNAERARQIIGFVETTHIHPSEQITRLIDQLKYELPWEEI